MENLVAAKIWEGKVNLARPWKRASYGILDFSRCAGKGGENGIWYKLQLDLPTSDKEQMEFHACTCIYRWVDNDSKDPATRNRFSEVGLLQME